MRVSALLFLLTAAQAVHAATIAENGFIVLGDRGADALSAAQRHGQRERSKLELRFRLSAPDAVWAEAEGLRGLRQDSDAAPEVFLDDTYLGNLKAAHGSFWRSPKKLALEAGEHVLLIRCADVQEADDLSINRVRVLGGGPAAGKRGTAVRRGDCAHPLARKDVPERLGKGLVLSVLSGRESRSGGLVTLADGEAWGLQVKLPKGPFGQVQAWMTEVHLPEPGRVRLLFRVNPELNPGTVDAKHYTPGEWEPLRFSWCGGVLGIDFARAGRLDQPVKGSKVTIEIAARDQEIALRPAP